MSPRTSTGQIIDGKYRLEARIGGGGMGDVYRAVNVLAGRTVAIKLLHADLVDNEELAKRFFQEARAINRIRHPNIVDVLDAGTGELGPYIVMELLEGESTGQILARLGRLPVDAALATAIAVLAALDAAHRAGIIHRDLKPENVFIAVDAVSRNAVVRLLDFGIAKVLDARATSSPRTRTGVVFGTPDYLSPEQATGDKPLDGRSDLFAVGALLYELLTGAPPFRASTSVATAFKVVHDPTPTLAAAGVPAGEPLERVLHKLLEKDPAARFQTAGEVARKLSRLVPDASQRKEALASLLDPGRWFGLGGAAGVLGTRDSAVLPSSEARRLRAASGASEASEASAEAAPLSGLEPTRPVPVAPAAPPMSQRRKSSESPSPRPKRGAGTRPRSDTAESAVAVSPAGVSMARTEGIEVAHPAPRPFPSHLAGRFSVRGPVLRSVDRAVLSAFGAAARDGVLVRLRGRHADDVRAGVINALVSYDLETLDGYLELASLALAVGRSRWRELGREAVAGELESFLRSALRSSPDLPSAARRGISVWQRFFSFGAWRVLASGGAGATVHIAELEPASASLREWLVGVIEATMSSALGRKVRGAIAAGGGDFEPELSIELAELAGASTAP